MTLLARPALPTVIDTSTKLTAYEAAALYQAGVRSVWRYVFFGPPRAGDLDAAELQLLLAAGLTVMVVQHVRNPGWTATADQGDADGQVAVANAMKAGYQSAGGALSLAVDLEGCKSPHADQYAMAWCAQARAGGYLPVCYIGFASGMTSADLDRLGPDVALWCDFAPLSLRPSPQRGYALHQQAQTTLCGVGVDVDAILVPDALVGLGDGDVNTETVDPMHDTEKPPPDAA